MSFKVTANVTMMIDAMDEDEALSIAEDRLVEIDIKLGWELEQDKIKVGT